MNVDARITLTPSSFVRSLDDQMKKAVRDAAAYIMRSARNAIRKSPYPSSPGTPPHTRTGRLRHAITFKVSDDGMSAEIGVGNFSNVSRKTKAIAELHEYGGVQPTEEMPPMLGGSGPIDIKGQWITGKQSKRADAYRKQFSFTHIRTPAQLTRSRKLYEMFFGGRRASTVSVYPERPFMGPTLAAKWGEIFKRMTEMRWKQ